MIYCTTLPLTVFLFVNPGCTKVFVMVYLTQEMNMLLSVKIACVLRVAEYVHSSCIGMLLYQLIVTISEFYVLCDALS